MTKTVQEIIDDLGKAVVEMKAVNERSIAEVNKRFSDVITREHLDRVCKDVAELSTLKSRIEAVETKAARPGGSDLPEVRADKARRVTKAFGTFLRDGDATAFNAELKGIDPRYECKALTVGTNAQGGFTVPPVVEQMIMANVLDISPLRGMVRVVPVANSDYRQNVNTRGLASGWVAEGGSRTVTNTPTFAQVTFTHGELYALAQASNWVLNDSGNDIVALLNNDIAEEFAFQEGVAITSGNGTDKPTGFTAGTPVATDDGARAFGVVQYVATGVAADFAATNPADTFISLAYKIKAAYRRNAQWAMNKNTLGTVMKFKDTTGQYLWRAGLERGQPATFNGYPIAELESLASVGANTFPVAFGDFSQAYTLIDIAGMTMIRDPYAVKGHTQFYVSKRVGGKIVKDEAVKLIKCAIT